MKPIKLAVHKKSQIPRKIDPETFRTLCLPRVNSEAIFSASNSPYVCRIKSQFHLKNRLAETNATAISH